MKKICSYVSRLLVAVMLLGLLLPMTVIAADVSYEEKTATVVSSKKDVIPPVILSDLGFAEPDDVEKDSTEFMTRAEFATLLIRLRGINDVTSLNYDKKEFVDVNSEYYEDAFIHLAVKLGYMQPIEHGWFYPKQAVSYIDVVRGFVNLLGFQVFVNKQGSGESAYLSVAANQKITKNCSPMADGTITRGDIYAMAINCLDINIMAESRDNAVDVLSIEQGRTLLTEYHNIYKDEGIVEANEFTYLHQSSKNAGKKSVVIDKNNFVIKNDAYSKFLGYNVSYYYNETVSGEKIILHMVPRRTETLTVDATDISSYFSRTYTYYDNNKNRLEKISVNRCYIIYNGISAEGKPYTAIPQNGEVVFLDNDEDGEYDVCLINSYDEYVVKQVDVDREIIYAEYGKSLDISTAEMVSFSHADSDKNVSLGALAKGQVLSVLSDIDNEMLQIIVSDRQVNGVVSEISVDEETTLMINNSEYEISSDMQAALDSGKLKNVAVGKNYLFFLNHKNEIAFYDDSVKSAIGEYEYGILTGVSKSHGLNKELKMKIFTSLGMFEIFSVAEKIYLDEILEKDMDKVYTELCKNGENGEIESQVVPQVIRFRINTDLEVTHIDRAGTKNPDQEGLYLSYDAREGEPYYSSGPYGFTFDRIKINFAINKIPLIFSVPMENGRIQRGEDEMFTVKNNTVFSNNTQYKVVFYKADPKIIEQEVVLIANEREPGSSGLEVEAEADVNVFLKSVTALDVDGNPGQKIYYSPDGYEKSIFVDSSIDINAIPVKGGGTHSLKRGDIFRFSVDGNGRLNAIEVAYDHEKECFLGENAGKVDIAESWHPNTTMYLSKLNVHTVSDLHILASYGHPDMVDTDDIASYYIVPTTNRNNGTFEYDTLKNTVKPITAESIFDYASAGEDYSRGFYWGRYADTKTIIIYK